jgi:hypothetical protein
MTNGTEFQSIDIAALTTVPLLSAAGYVSLIKSLSEVQPKDPPKSVQKAMARMQASREHAEQALDARLGGDVDAALERSFDLLVDRVWLFLRSQLEFWSIYEHEGIELFTEQQQDEIDLDGYRALAKVADDLLDRLFGTDGSEFLRLPYMQQAAHMASRLRLIANKGLGESFEELVGARMVKLLAISQQRYESMVNARTARESGVVADLREQRASMQRSIQLYAVAVLGMLDEDDASTAGVVTHALTPVLVTRFRRSTGPEDDGVDELVGEPVESPKPVAG